MVNKNIATALKENNIFLSSPNGNCTKRKEIKKYFKYFIMATDF